jgi:hypothetical protein
MYYAILKTLLFVVSKNLKSNSLMIKKILICIKIYRIVLTAKEKPVNFFIGIKIKEHVRP